MFGRRLLLSQSRNLGGASVAIAAVEAGKDRHQPVVILLGDRVELVVVTTGAVDRQADAGGNDLGGHVVKIARTGGSFEDVAPRLDIANKIPGTGGEEPGGDNRIGVVWRNIVAGDLLAEELIVRLVAVQRADHVIAVRPRIVTGAVALETVSVGVVGHVKPVARPVFAVVRRGEESLDQFFIGIGSRVGHEGLRFLGGGWEPQQVEAKPTDQSSAVGLGIGREPFLFELRQDERIDGIANPPGPLHCRRRGDSYRLNRPIGGAVAGGVMNWFWRLGSGADARDSDKERGQKAPVHRI